MEVISVTAIILFHGKYHSISDIFSLNDNMYMIFAVSCEIMFIVRRCGQESCFFHYVTQNKTETGVMERQVCLRAQHKQPICYTRPRGILTFQTWLPLTLIKE